MSDNDTSQRSRDSIPIETRMRIVEQGHELVTQQVSEVNQIVNALDARIEDAVSRAFDSSLDRLVIRLQDEAVRHTGRFFLGALRALVTKYLVIAFVVLWVGKFAGVPMAVALFDKLLGFTPK